MSGTEALKIIDKLRACHFCDDCKLNCQDCIYNYTEEELQEALSIASNAIRKEEIRHEIISVP